MKQSLPNKSPAAIRKLFGAVADRYDLLNQLMSLGQDQRWRRAAVRLLNPPQHGWLLDAGTGTGDLAVALKEKYPQANVAACDITPEMIHLAKQRPEGQSIYWVIADAHFLPFSKDQFTGIASGFMVRNTPDPIRTFSEQHRVLQPSGRMVCLETTPPPEGWIGMAIRFYLRQIVPLLGKIFAGNPTAYAYLRDSTENFQNAARLAHILKQAGFNEVFWIKRMFGAVAIHAGRK